MSVNINEFEKIREKTKKKLKEISELNLINPTPQKKRFIKELEDYLNLSYKEFKQIEDGKQNIKGVCL